MSKRESTIRQHLIISKIRKSPCSFEAIKVMLKRESELAEYDLNISQRTFQRDLNEIRSVYGVDIQYIAAQNIYEIADDDHNPLKERMFDAFELVNTLQLSQRVSDSIHFESRRALGTENALGILHAIRNEKRLEFSYHKFWESESTERTIEPYALKEYRQRWYVVGRDLADNRIKTFGLDRLSDIFISKKSCTQKGDFDVEEHFKYCFGIISPTDESPEEIILSFNAWQGKYIKSLPLHHTQETLVDNEDEFRIRLKLFLTHDFLMEVLSYGENVVVVQPAILVNLINETFLKCSNNYKAQY